MLRVLQLGFRLKGSDFGGGVGREKGVLGISRLCIHLKSTTVYGPCNCSFKDAEGTLRPFQASRAGSEKDLRFRVKGCCI